MAEGFRSLADQLRSWPDERLSLLLSQRPDLATPAPHDSGQLASRAATRSSLLRVLDQLDRLELSVLDALVVLGQTSIERLQGLVNASPDSVRTAAERLVDLALAWESSGGLRALTGVGDGLAVGGGEGASGLRAFSADAPDIDVVDQRLAEVSAEARALLTHVDEHGGEATTEGSRHTVTPEDAATPAEELLSRRLLVSRDGRTVVVPGEVGIALRGGRTARERVDEPPALATSARDAALVDRTAAGSAFEAVRRTELLLDLWAADSPASLRSGGLGVRDLRATSRALHLDESTVALLAETASACGLLTSASDPEGDLVWMPTDLFDGWTLQPAADRWVHLVQAWLRSPRMPGLVGSRDTAGKTWNALAPELAGIHMAEARRMTLTALASLPPGEVLDPGTGAASLLALLEWQRPRRPRARAEQVAWTLVEAAALGITALGAVASYSRLLLTGDDAGARKALSGLLPDPVDHILLQADLTAVAPGPLESTLARTLQLLADVESQGGATVYRFTPTSVRRALDTGWTALELHDFLGSVSRTPVPQPLTYLVDDTARTFGSVRVGYAEAFLRADDEAALTELLHHPGARTLGLRRLAPTVLVSSTPLDVLLPRLRELGASPVVEAEDGSVHVARPDVRRARTPREHRRDGHGPRRQASLPAVVKAIRAGDRAAASRPTSPSQALSPSGSLAALRDAAESGSQVLISYVDNHGTRSERIVEPVSVEGGVLTAHDQRSDDTRTFAIHRITTVRAVEARG